MKHLSLVLGFFFFLMLFSSCADEEFVDVDPVDETEETARYHWEHVNPAGLTFIVYQGAAFCGDGFSNQIQIWTSSLQDCQCALSEFVADCDSQIKHYYPCTQTTSQYPPIGPYCTG